METRVLILFFLLFFFSCSSSVFSNSICESLFCRKKKVLVRGSYSGVFFGTLLRKRGSEVKLSNCRRLSYWEGAASLHQLATEGTKKPDKCLFSISVDKIEILDIIEIVPCTRESIESIESVGIWKIS